MTVIDPAALHAAALAIHQERCRHPRGHCPGPANSDRLLALLALEAAERAHPHDPPKRSPESTTAGTFTIRHQPPKRLDGIGFMANPIHLLDSEEPSA